MSTLLFGVKEAVSGVESSVSPGSTQVDRLFLLNGDAHMLAKGSGTVTHVGLKLGVNASNSPGSGFRVALYSVEGTNTAKNLVAYGEITTPVQGVNIVALNTPVSGVVAGVTKYILGVHSKTNWNPIRDPHGNHYWYGLREAPYADGVPADVSTLTALSSGNALSDYLVWAEDQSVTAPADPTLSGTLVNRQGAPVANAMNLILIVDGVQVTDSLSTDSQGNWSFGSAELLTYATTSWCNIKNADGTMSWAGNLSTQAEG